jgi:hypothetical protein
VRAKPTTKENEMNQRFGVNVWWTVPETIVDAVKVRDALVKHGFEATDIPLPTRRQAVSRAAYSMHNRRTKEDRRVTERTQDNGRYVVWGILDQKRVNDERVRFTQSTTVRLDKQTDEVLVEGKRADKVREAIDRYADHMTDDDIRKFLCDSVRACLGIPKRPTGGIYFVPEHLSEMLRDVQAVLADLDVGAKLYVEGVINGEQERRNVWEAVEGNIDSTIAKTLADVERIGKRVSSVHSKQAKLDGLSELMDVYKGLLGTEAEYEDITERLRDAEQVVADKITVLEQGTAAKAKKSIKAPKVVKAKAPKAPAQGKVARVQGRVEVAIQAIEAEGHPLTAQEILDVAVREGIYSPSGKDPRRSMEDGLNKVIRKDNSRIDRVGKGTYGIPVAA